MADEVVIEDPIGPSVTNPDGNGVRGKEVGSFFDQDDRRQPSDRHVRGDVSVQLPRGRAFWR